MKKIKVLVILFLSAIAPMFNLGMAFAADPGCYKALPNGLFYDETTCASSEDQAVVQSGQCVTYEVNGGKATRDCVGVKTSTDTGNSTNTDGQEVLETDCGAERIDAENCQIVKYLVSGINFLSALAGLAIVGSIMVAGYQYMTARDNSGQIEAAKKRIIWAIVALILFIFMYSILNFLVPGGVL
jgi:Type IV secretion system pilin